MKRPSILMLSLAGNLVLAAFFMLLRQDLRSTKNTECLALPPPQTDPGSLYAQVAKQASAPILPWQLIAAPDYRQYVKNLRAVGCPEWLVRDITVADVDDVYSLKSVPGGIEAPWQTANQVQTIAHGRAATLAELRRQKRALVKSFLGYEWEYYAEEVWNQDLSTSLNFGFLTDDKAIQTLALVDSYREAAQTIRDKANYILIDTDRAQLNSLYQRYEADLSKLLDPTELDELQLRAQQPFLTANDIHFDAVTISQEELRQIVRMSKEFKNIAQNEFVPDRPLSDSQQAELQAAFAAKVKDLVGSQRFEDYQRAQKPEFREIFAFSQQNNLPQNAAVAVFESRQYAAEQVDEIQKDATLSADERLAALTVLQDATHNAVSATLGGSYQSYLQGPGQWLGAIAQAPGIQTAGQTP
jgi:hypothetical protein